MLYKNYEELLKKIIGWKFVCFLETCSLLDQNCKGNWRKIIKDCAIFIDENNNRTGCVAFNSFYPLKVESIFSRMTIRVS